MDVGIPFTCNALPITIWSNLANTTKVVHRYG
jgi:hypothetical protein